MACPWNLGYTSFNVTEKAPFDKSYTTCYQSAMAHYAYRSMPYHLYKFLDT